jgi:hypothetical protein
VYRDPVRRQPEREGHWGVIWPGAMVLKTSQDWKRTEWGRLLIGPVQDNRSPDLMTPAKNGQELLMESNPDPQRAWRNSIFIPAIIAILHGLANIK